MAITKNSGRQNILVAEVTLAYNTLASDEAVAEAVIDLPAGARVVGGDLIVDTVFNSTTSDVLDIGDSTDDNEYTATPIDLTSLGRTALDITGFKYTTADSIKVEWTAGATGTASTGSARLQVHYTIEGRALENQPVR